MGLSVRVPAGTTLSEAADLAGVALDRPCGGRGRCGKCVVLVSPAAGTAVTGRGRRALGRVLACREKAAADLVVRVPSPTQAFGLATVGLTEARAAAFRFDPPLTKVYLPPEFLRTPSPAGGGLWQAISAAFEGAGTAGGRTPPPPSLSVLRELAAAYPVWKRSGVTAIVSEGVLLGVEPGDTTAARLGMALDIGTTTVAAYLYDLATGRRLAAASALNGQVSYGGDVISRISLANADGRPDRLRDAVVATVADLVRKTCREAGVDPEAVYEVVAVGNSTMQALFLGLQPTSLGFYPFWVTQKDAQTAPASAFPELGINPRGQVVFLPLLGGYVGADTTAVILATGLARSSRVRLAIDIGTNGEMVLGSRAGLWACSTAAGPALEGAGISCGMRALPGAVDDVRIEGGKVRVATIGGRPPLGLCGSGVVSAVAELVRTGIVAPSGRLTKPGEPLPSADASAEALAARLTWVPAGSDRPGEPVGGDRPAVQAAFTLVEASDSGNGEPIRLTQADIRAVQLAKAAIAAGVKLLCAETGTGPGDIAEVFLAGAFGNYIDIGDAKRIGLLPDYPGVPVTPVGNAAGAGAEMALLSRAARAAARALARRVTVVDLSSRPDFQKVFAASIGFPPPRA